MEEAVPLGVQVQLPRSGDGPATLAAGTVATKVVQGNRIGGGIVPGAMVDFAPDWADALGLSNRN